MSKRAVYYARISTESNEQVESFPKQCHDLEDCIKKNGWDEVDSYLDEGKSATSSKTREDYNRLLDDMSKDRYDIIVVKSLDRLNRNEMDWYYFLNELKINNKQLFIYMDNKFFEKGDAFISGIKSIINAEYSRELSRKLNNAHRRREAEGSSIMSNNRLLGYNKEKGELIIDENEAKIVQKIYDMYVNEKLGIREIINRLDDQSITTDKGKKFGASTINRILKNEKYMGTLICNKQHKDFDTKKVLQVKKEEWIIHENRIPAIITKDQFDKAQHIRNSRRQEFNPKGSKTGKRVSRHPLGGKIFCGECGKIMWYNAVKKTNKNLGGYRYPWMCSTFCQLGRLGTGKFPEEGCNKINVNDEFLTREIIKFIDKLNTDSSKNELISSYINRAEELIVFDHEKIDIEKTLENIKDVEKKQSLLVDKYLENIIPEEVYKRKNYELENKLINLRIELEKMQSYQDAEYNKEEHLKNLRVLCESQLNGEISYETFCDMICKIVAYNDRIEIYLYLMEDMCFVVNDPLVFITNTRKKTEYKDARIKR